ncbi:MAG: DUF6596 domain-containing protein [Candidatus Caenarcaniphilales bacterium]|nr:DUF6596 domain-containing protein [Candidatus Caenarcaniphilales bacterium]
MIQQTQKTLELTVRASYGRLLAYLKAQSLDLAMIEDALSDSLMAALETWPKKGVPPNPEAWLLVTARRKLIDGYRRSKVHEATEETLKFLTSQIQEQDVMIQSHFPDHRLKLLFVCAHPAIDPNVRTPLMLQTILGFNAKQIAEAFLVSPVSISQRLVRAKSKIQSSGIRFEIPEEKELPERLDSVLEAIYAAYNHGWHDFSGVDEKSANFREEAIWLARLCAKLLPNQAEAQGLLALILFCESRYKARISDKGVYIPLSEQDTNLWQKSLIEEAEQILKAAAEKKQIGHFQLEAAIQSVHSERYKTGKINERVLLNLYEALLQFAPFTGAFVACASAEGQFKGPQEGLKRLEEIPEAEVSDYQPYWAVKANLLKSLGRHLEAKHAYLKAIVLTKEPFLKSFLEGELLKLNLK